MSSATKLAGFICGVIAMTGILLTCVLPYWKVSSWQSSDGLFGRIPSFDGVWWHCMSPISGGFTCNNYGKPSIYSSADIQSYRALMCIASLSSFFGTLLALLSLDCTTMVTPETKGKNRVALVAGSAYILGALCCGIAVSWYAWKVVYEFTHPLYQQKEFKYEFGACLYLGWVSMLLSFISGLVLICVSCKTTEDKDDYRPYTYNPPTSKTDKHPATEYV